MRCNLVPSYFLTDQHLIAEKRELRMIPPILEKRAKTRSPITGDIPERFCLGKGHQIFWLDKFLYLEKRYNSLTEEMIRRGFKPNLELSLDTSLAKYYGLYNDWTPEPEDYDLIVARLIEKINQKFKWYRYCGKSITRQWVEVTYPLPYCTMGN